MIALDLRLASLRAWPSKEQGHAHRTGWEIPVAFHL